MSFVVLNK